MYASVLLALVAVSAPVGSAAALAPDRVAAPVSAVATVTAEASRGEGRPDRARRAQPAPARRLVRKREVLEPAAPRPGDEGPDPSVPALAADLERSAAVRYRYHARAGARTLTRHRLVVAGLAAGRLHLPPPQTLL